MNQETLQQIEEVAPGLSENEVSQYIFGKDFSELSIVKQKEFSLAYTRAQTNLKLAAIAALRLALCGRQGLPAALSILTRFGDKWEKMDKGGVFNFKISAE